MKTLEDLDALDDYLLAWMGQMAPAGRRKLLTKVIKYLRSSTSKRITAQKNPDGSRWEPRRKRMRDKSGRIRAKKMMLGMRNRKNLRTKVTADEASIGYTGRPAKIAETHQYGKVDRVVRGGPLHRYAERKLLGVSREDKEAVRDIIIEHFQPE